MIKIEAELKLNTHYIPDDVQVMFNERCIGSLSVHELNDDQVRELAEQFYVMLLEKSKQKSKKVVYRRNSELDWNVSRDDQQII